MAVVGLGAVGEALARGLTGSGARLWLVSRRPDAASALAAELAAAIADQGKNQEGSAGTEPPFAQAVESLGAVDEALDAVLLCVSEIDLEDKAVELAQELALLPESHGTPVVLHTNGLYGDEVLAPLAEIGCRCGRLHPLVSLPPRRSEGSPPVANPLHGVGFALGGDPEAFDLGARLAAELGGRGFELLEGAAPLYHAAASLLAGGTVALFAAARRLLEETLADAEASADELARALFASVARNLEQNGPEAALTGPAARGAKDVVAQHLDALGETEPALAEVYGALAEEALRLALVRGSIDAEGAASVRRALAEGADDSDR